MLFTDIVRITSCFNSLFTFLCQHDVLAAQQVCVCGTPMVLKERSGIQDGHSWRCSNKDCRKWRSIRYGSFFEGSHISVIKWVQVIFLWSIDEPNKKIETLTGISLHTIVQMLTAIRSVCSNSLLLNAMGLWNGWAWRNWTCCTHSCTESTPRDPCECHTETWGQEHQYTRMNSHHTEHYTSSDTSI